MTPRDVITLNFKKSILIEILISDKIVADLTHQWSDSEPEVDTVGIYVKIIMVRIEKAAFGYDLTYEILISDRFSSVA